MTAKDHGSGDLSATDALKRFARSGTTRAQDGGLMKSVVLAPGTEAILHCGGMVLEPIVPAHADALFEALQAPELYTFIPLDPPSKDALRERYTRWAARKSADGAEVWVNYAVRRADEPTYVGTVQATVVPSAETQIAYEVFPPFQRRGYARRACAGLLRHLFASWPIDRVRAHVDDRNVASCALLDSLGFRRIGHISNADHFKGASSSEYVYELGRPISAG